MKSSMTQRDKQSYYYNSCEDSMWPLKNKLYSYEIEHDENVTHWDDYQKCEIPCDLKEKL
ncbi:MAG: hypothetical protein ACJAWX_003025 [Algoriphagus sp.]|jgi:hypothetical protein